MTPVELAARLARRGYRLFYWYGYESVCERGWALHAISCLAPGIDLWCGDVMMPAPFIFPERSGPLGLWHRLGKYDRERGRHVRPARDCAGAYQRR